VGHFVAFGEAHLRRILRADAIITTSERTIIRQRCVGFSFHSLAGFISSRPVFGGLHHHYFRV
jgi:hypothetical protein